MGELVAFRASDHHQPFFAAPQSANQGRWRPPDRDIAVQFWAVHPLGPLAEKIRRLRDGNPNADFTQMRQRIWAARIVGGNEYRFPRRWPTPQM